MHAVGDTGATPVPAFLTKLWTLVEDPSTDEFIFWDMSGKSFHVYDQGRFSKEVLPLYFKHSNIASFIRQLNMYGFRKVVGVESGGLKVERDDMEFAHQFFQRDNENLLEHIKRKRGMSSQVLNVKADEMKVRPDDVQRVLNDVRTMKGKQDSVNSKLEAVKRENELLWLEIANLRQKHMKQQQIVNKLIQFLMSLVGNRGVDRKRKMPLMLNDASQIESGKMPKFTHSRSIEPSAKGYQVTSPEVETAEGDDQVSTSTLSIHEVTEPIYEQARAYATKTLPTAACSSTATSHPTPTPVAPNKIARKNISAQLQQLPSLDLECDVAKDADIDDDEADVQSQNILRELVAQNVPPIHSLNTEMVSDEPLLTLATDALPLDSIGFGQLQKLATSGEMSQTAETRAVAPRVTDAVLGAGAIVPANVNRQPNNPKVLNREISDHLDTMQGDLDSLKDLLSGGQYTFEPSTIMGMFELGGGVPTEQQPATANADFILGHEVVQYNPPDDIMSMFDFGDLSSATTLEDEDEDDMPSGLNTPYISPELLDMPRFHTAKPSTTTSTEEVD